MAAATEVLNQLKTFQIFEEVHSHQLEEILLDTQSKTFARKTHLFAQFEQIEHLYFLLEGQVKLYRMDHRGNEQIVNIACEGEMFPHIGFFRPQTYPAYAEAMKTTTVLAVSLQPFKRFIHNHPVVCEKLINIMEDKMIDLQSRLEEKMLYPLCEQVILLLIRLRDQYGQELNNEWIIIRNHFSNRELASLIGSTRETINRYLNDLRKQGIVKFSDEGNILIHKKKLSKIIDFNVR
ncbi:Crp/Fnr family transcriptional regulator [Cytobacillus massiliigabonensis]|uniref:Crp/Fnr family transcriptional regulator n=1 Tax=Cytobacillus massiliigabonensis TaxID=1871011 RepID=UPI00115B03F6|nr:Crp/Fnr family transcriptional regulator [Cytobacillus massiliigabonensis]